MSKEHFVLDSEYLTTLLVCVPLATMNDWHSKYEQLTDMVVPRFALKYTDLNTLISQLLSLYFCNILLYILIYNILYSNILGQRK